MAPTSTAAPPVSVRRKSRTGASRLRNHAVCPWKGAGAAVSAVAVAAESVTAAQDNARLRLSSALSAAPGGGALAESANPRDQQLEEAIGVDAHGGVAVWRPPHVVPEIDVGSAAGQLRTRVDHDPAVPGGEERRVDHVRHGDGVVPRCPVPAVPAAVIASVEPEQVGDELARFPGGFEARRV